MLCYSCSCYFFGFSKKLRCSLNVHVRGTHGAVAPPRGRPPNSWRHVDSHRGLRFRGVDGVLTSYRHRTRCVVRLAEPAHDLLMLLTSPPVEDAEVLAVSRLVETGQERPTVRRPRPWRRRRRSADGSKLPNQNRGNVVQAGTNRVRVVLGALDIAKKLVAHTLDVAAAEHCREHRFPI